MPRGRHITNRDGTWHYKRRVPRHVQHLDKRGMIRESLHTDDEAVALAKAREIDRNLALAWDAMEDGAQKQADDLVTAAKRICRSQGFGYRTAEELGQGPVVEVVRRVEKIQELTPASKESAPELVRGLLGGVSQSSIKLSEAFAFYMESARDHIHGKSASQVRYWTNHRRLSAKYMIEALGDREVASLTCEDMLLYRASMWGRVEAGQIQADTANKYMGFAKIMLEDVDEKRGVGLASMSGLRFNFDEDREVPPFSTPWICDVILRPGALDGINAEARNVILAMVETGMRPSEIVNFKPEHLQLDDEIPHVQIRATPGRQIKTKQSKRDIPLVGAALRAFEEQREGFPRYADKGGSLSKTVNKYMRENGLLETGRHKFYSFRHSFEDRMMEAGVDDRMRAMLMGHKYDQRAKYGEGYSLAKRAEFLRKMAIT